LASITDFDHAFDRSAGARLKDSVCRSAPLEGVMHALDDVSALPELLQGLLPTLGDAPRGGRGALDQAQLLQDVEPRKGVRAREPGRVGDRRHVDGAHRRNQLAQPPVDRRQALLRYLLGELPLDVEFIPRSKLEGSQLLSANTESLGDVAAIDPDLGATTVDAADDDVNVRVVGVVVTDGGPVQPAAQILFHPLHEPARVVAQVQLVAILGGDDEAELTLLSGDRGGEGLALDVAAAVEQTSLGTVLLDTVALDVSQVLASRLSAARADRDVARLDDAAPRRRGRWPNVMACAGVC
jgi:hypothetical protein